MASDPLLVPTITVTGTLHFVEVPPDARAQEVVQKVIEIDGVKEEVLGGLEGSDWALQRIRVEQTGRAWEEDELSSLGDGEQNMSLHIPVVRLTGSLIRNCAEQYCHCSHSERSSPQIAFCHAPFLVVPNDFSSPPPSPALGLLASTARPYIAFLSRARDSRRF
jgi:hypothetical protein